MNAFWIAYGVEWLNLVVRWLHVITGIAWIGASFYFVWLDNTIRPPAPGSDLAARGVSGELWAVHGGEANAGRHGAVAGTRAAARPCCRW